MLHDVNVQEKILILTQMLSYRITYTKQMWTVIFEFVCLFVYEQNTDLCLFTYHCNSLKEV